MWEKLTPVPYDEIPEDKLNHLFAAINETIAESKKRLAKTSHGYTAKTYRDGIFWLKKMNEVVTGKCPLDPDYDVGTALEQFSIKVAEEYDVEYSNILSDIGYLFDQCFFPKRAAVVDHFRAIEEAEARRAKGENVEVPELSNDDIQALTGIRYPDDE